jgi:NAD(P)-dependent dehydrogenase (short-subunit alcohol dehydrogenase family)
MTDLFSYQDRRVVVTGGSRGVGAALLDVLAELDVTRVTVLDLNPPSGPHDTFLATDLADEQSVRAAIAALDNAGSPIHALFNNAGVADTQSPRTVLSVNYLALRTLSDGLLERMPEGSAIVNTASTAGHGWRKRAKEINELLDVDVADGWSVAQEWLDEHLSSFDEGPYNFSKSVVELYTLRASRPSMRQGVRMNAACPGPIDTPLLSDFRATASDKILDWNIREMAGRPVSPREVASVLAFLGCPAASYVNGVTLEIDGGFFAAMATGQVDYSGRT